MTGMKRRTYELLHDSKHKSLKKAFLKEILGRMT